MPIPTEPIGSIPRPQRLLDALDRVDGADRSLDPLYEEAVRDTVRCFEATGSPVVTDGEQRKFHNFWTYCVHGLRNTGPEGFKIPFAAGHVRRMPRLTSGLYPEEELPGYPRDQFIHDLLDEHETEVRRCLHKGAHKVQIDFTEGAWRSSSTRRAGCCRASSTSTTSRSIAFPTPSGSASACTPVGAAIATRRTAQTSTTPSSCRVCSS